MCDEYMKKVNPSGLIHRLFLFFVLCSSFLLHAPDAVSQPKFMTFSVNEKNDGAPGTFGWKPFNRSSSSFSLTFKAIKPWDQFISIKNDTSQVDIVIGGWGNTHGAVHFFENEVFVGGYWVCSEEKPVDGCIKMPGCTSIIPDTTNPVEYTMTLVQGAKAGEGLCRVVAKKQDGTTVKIIETSHPGFNKSFSFYSFKAWNGPVQIADDTVTLLDTPLWLKVAGSNKYVEATGTGVLQATDKKPGSVSFVITSFGEDVTKKIIFCRANNNYVVLRNLLQIDSDNLGEASKDAAKISAEEQVINIASFGRLFALEPEGSGVKIKSTSGSTYLRVDDDGFVRAFKPDPAKGNKYVAPISKAEATLFIVEEAAVSTAPMKSGDIVAFRFQDGSYLGFDSFKRGGEARQVRQNTIGLMDPSTHFKVFYYTDEWKERGIIALSTYGYDIALDDSSDPAARAKSLSESGHGLFADYNEYNYGVKNGFPTRMRVSARKDAPVYNLEYDAASASKQKFSFGFAGQKVSRNTSAMPVDGAILKVVNASTPVGDYKFEIIPSLAQYQRLLEGAALPASLPVQNISTAMGVALTPANLYPWDLAGGLNVSAPYIEIPEGLKRGFIATFECNAAADLNIGFASRPWGDVAMGYCYGIMQLHAGANNNTQSVYDNANVVNKVTPYGLNADKTQYAPDIVKFAAPAVLPAPGVFTKYRIIADFQSSASRKLALEYLGGDNLYHEIFSVPFGIDQNMPNPPVDQDGLKFLGFRCGAAGFTVKNLSIRELVRGQAAASAPMTLAVAKTDVASKFKPAFEAAGKTAEDWAGLVELFKNYITLASALGTFTEPEGNAPASSLRDKSVALITAALTTAPANVKPALQDLQAFLLDIPTWLPDPATPPAAIPNLTKGACVAFNIAPDLFLGVGSDGKLGAIKTSIYDPAIHFSVQDYNLANNRMIITLGDSARSISTSTEWLRVYQAADQTLSLGLTQIPRAIDVTLNQNPASTVSFAYAGAPVICTPASLGLTSGGSVKNFTICYLSTDRLQQDKCFRVKADRKLASGQLSMDIFLWATNFKRGSQVFSELDWNFYTKGLADYAIKAQQISDDWKSPVTDEVQKICASLVPDVVVNGSCGATNAEFMQRVLAYVQSAAGITAAARDNVVKGWLAFVPLKAGLKITLKGDSGSLLMREIVDKKSVFKMSGTSTYNPNTRFEVSEFIPTTGIVVLKNSEGLYLAVDAATKDLVFTNNRAELTVIYDFATKKIKLGSAGKFAQVDAVTKNVKMTAELAAGLSFVVQSIEATDSPLFASIATDPLDVAIQQKLKPLFMATAGKTADDWQYFLSVLSSYIQAKLVTPDDYVAWGVRRADLANASLRDDVIAFLTSLKTLLTQQVQTAQSPAKDALQQVLTQCAQIVTQLQDVPVYVNRTEAQKPITAIAAQNTITLKVGDGLYLVPNDGGGLKAAATLPLDPATHIFVTAYDQQKGRAVFKVGEKYLDLSPAAPYEFVLKSTPRYVDVLCDVAVATRFSFVVAGTKVALDSSKLGALVTAPVEAFDVVGALSNSQKSFKDVLDHMKNVPTVDVVKGDILNCFDALFTQLGTYPGDWLYFVQRFDAYLRFVSATIRLDSVQLTGVRGGALSLKDYAARLLTAISGQYSSAPQDAQVAAKQTLQWLSGGAAPSNAATDASAVLAAGATVFMQTVAPDLVTKQKLAWTGDALVLAAQLHDIDKSLHFKVLAYDAAAKAVVFGNNTLVFDPATCTFVAKPIKDVQPLSLQSVAVSGLTYYYLKNAAGAQLAIGSSGASFGESGDLFDFAKIADTLLQIDALADPKVPADFENGLIKFVGAFDLVAGDALGLTYVLNVFDAYCTKAAAFPSWSTEKTSAGPIFKEYARTLLSVVMNSDVYTGRTDILKTRISEMLANGPAFSASVIPVASTQAPATPSDEATNGTSATSGQISYSQLDGNKGILADDLAVFNSALEKSHEDTTELSNIFNALNIYLGAATKRFDWYAQGALSGGVIPRDYSVAMLQRLLDNDWFYTGLTEDLKQKTNTYILNSKNNAASYPAQMVMLDTYAKAITKAEDLTASSQLVQLLKSFVTELLGIGIPPQLRAQVLKKIDMYFDRSMVPALQLSRIDAQKNSWSLLLFGLELQLLAGEATSLELLDEKTGAFEQVIIPRLKILDAVIQLDAISSFFDLIKTLAISLKKLVPDTKNARFTRFTAIVFTYVDFVLKQNAQDADLSEEQKNTVAGLQEMSRQIKVKLGIEQSVSVKPINGVPTPAPVSVAPASSSQTSVATAQAQARSSQQTQVSLQGSTSANSSNTRATQESNSFGASSQLTSSPHSFQI